VARGAIDLGARAVGAPDQVRVEPDHRIASAGRAALDRLEQEAVRPSAGHFQECRDRRFQIGDQRGPHHLRLAARIARRECVFRRLDLHQFWSALPPATAWRNAV
jgi:hypothetical protein